MTQARLYRSLRPSRSRSPAACSGLMYSGVPMVRPTSVTFLPSHDWQIARAIPKSAITAVPVASNHVFGLHAGWMHFDGHVARVTAILRDVDGRHPAAAELAVDRVAIAERGRHHGDGVPHGVHGRKATLSCADG